MSAPRHRQKRDVNENDIIEYALNPYKPIVWKMDAKFGCDILLFYLCTVEFVEIKNPDYVTADGNLEKMLTDNERELKQRVESVGKTYWIIATIEQGAAMMDKLRERCMEE